MGKQNGDTPRNKKTKIRVWEVKRKKKKTKKMK